MRTCLFTGEQLSETTKEEHTLPRGIGGRIRSRIVSGDRFNNDCGSYLDKILRDPYALIMNKLEPMLATEHQSGPLEVLVPGEPAGLVLDKGVVTRRGRAILAKDPETQRPKTAVAADEQSLRNLAKQLGKEDSMTLSTTQATQATTFFREAPIILAELEIGALKSALLAFDHALADTPSPFIRDPALEPVRSFIAETVRTRKINGEQCHRFSLGMQYERLPMYRQIRDSMMVPKTPFEHVLLAASNSPRRCIDVVWIVLGFDPFGFRVTTDWWGEDFAMGIVSGVLKCTSASGVISFPVPLDPLCLPTDRRAFPDSVPGESARERILAEVSERRMAAYGEAVHYVELNADDLVRDNLVEAAILSPHDQRDLPSQVRARLVRMYGRKKDDPTFLQALDTTYAREAAGKDASILAQRIATEESAASVSWAFWLEIYRQCLRELVADFGLPGDAFSNTSESGTDRVDERRLGELPRETKMK